MAELRAVIFDFDGVLADSVPVYREAVAQAAGEAGVDGAGMELIAAADTRTVARAIIERYHLDVTVETLTDQIEKFALDRLLTAPRIVAGARSLLESIRSFGLRAAIASLAPRQNIDGILRQEGLLDFFAAIVTIENIERIKPDPEVYLKAAAALDVSPGDCIAIEDSDRGVTAALAAGMTVIALTTTLPADRLGHAHLVVPTLADLSLEDMRVVHQRTQGQLFAGQDL